MVITHDQPPRTRQVQTQGACFDGAVKAAQTEQAVVSVWSSLSNGTDLRILQHSLKRQASQQR